MIVLVKIEKVFLVGFGAITALSDFAKKKFKYVDELATAITGQLV